MTPTFVGMSYDLQLLVVASPIRELRLAVAIGEDVL
jgi:hypothetical protein